jgi:hypothetical protein
MLPVFAAAVNVNVAWVDAPAFRIAFCRFQVNASEELASLGAQLFVVIVRVSAMFPVFLMYTVWVAVYTRPLMAQQKISELQNADLVKKPLINQNDNPALAWSSQIPEKTSFFKWLTF